MRQSDGGEQLDCSPACPATIPCAPTRGALRGSQVTVLRDGHTQEIDTGQLVVGDVLLFDTGDILPADGMLFKGNEIRHAQFLPSI